MEKYVTDSIGVLFVCVCVYVCVCTRVSVLQEMLSSWVCDSAV